MKNKDSKKQIHLSEREARQGNASYEHLVLAGAMVVIALLIVGVFIYSGLGANGPTQLGSEPETGVERQFDRNTAENPYVQPGYGGDGDNAGNGGGGGPGATGN